MSQGTGVPPDSVLQFRAEAPITAYAGMLECGDYVFADDMGTLYRLDPLLNVTLLTRLQETVHKLTWSATGELGVALTRPNSLSGIDEKLKIVWTIELPFDCSALAMDPYGQYILAASVDGGFVLLDARGKRLQTVETIRPLAFAEFLVTEPVVLAAAEHGLIGAYDVKGTILWQEAIWSSVSDLTLIQQEGLTCLAAQNHGIQVFNGKGRSISSLVLEGTVNRLAASYSGNQIMAATVENHVYRIDTSGELLWAAEADSTISGLLSHPLGRAAVLVRPDVTAYRLQW